MASSEVRSLVGIRAVGYRRVSTEQQSREDKTSLADQTAAIEQRAARLGVTIGAWFEDDGVSGSTVEKRPGLLSLIASCEAHRRSRSSASYVIALNDSRWGRFPDVEEAGYWRHHLARHGWTVRFAEGDEQEDGFARSLERLAGAKVSGDYREHIIANTRRGSRSATIQGFWKGGSPPFGYVRKVCYPPGREQRVLPRGVRKAADERVMLWPEETAEAPFLRRLYELYANGDHGLVGLAEIANGEWPGRSWDSGALFAMLTNRVYLGHLRSGKGASAPEPYGKDGAHPALIDADLFARVAARLKANKRVRRGKNRTYLVTGLVTCSACGFPLVGSGGNSRGLSFYRCRGTCAPANPCHLRGSVIAAHRLDAAIRDVLSGEFRRAEVRAATRRHIDKYLDGIAARPALPVTDAIDARITKLDQQIQRLVEALAGGTLTLDDVGAKIKALKSSLAAAHAERTDVLRLSDRRQSAPVDRQSLYRMVDAMPALLQTLTGQEFRGAVLPWLRSATFDRDSKCLTVEIRRVPAIMHGGLSLDPLARTEQKATSEEFVTRTVALGRRRRVGGASS